MKTLRWFLPLLLITSAAAQTLTAPISTQIPCLGGHNGRCYTASATVTPASLATDIATISGGGSGGPTVLITGMHISCSQTTAGAVTVSIIKRSTPDANGTWTQMTAVPSDSSTNAAAAFVQSFTANPSGLGASLGAVDTIQLNCPTSPAVNSYTENWSANPIILRFAGGNNQYLVVNLNGTTVTGGAFVVTFDWAELKTNY